MATGHRYACWLGTALLLAAAVPVRAEGWIFAPRIGLSETYTNNVALAADGATQSDFVTEIKPGFSWRGSGARVKLNLDYELQDVLYARNSSANRTQNALNGSGTVEAVEHFLFIDARAAVSQQSISTFGPQPVSDASINANRTESRFFSLSPYVRGFVSDIASYEIRNNSSWTNYKSGGLSNTRSEEWLAKAASYAPLANFSWALDYSHRKVGFAGSSDSQFDTAKATLFYNFDPQFRVFVDAGSEKDDFGIGSQSYSNHGVGFSWKPMPLTEITGQREQRFFGSGYNFRFSHRTPLSAWSLGYLRDIATTADQFQVDVPSDFYTVLFNRSDLIALFPDPLQRDQQVRTLLAQLGLPASAGLQTLLANRVFLNRSLDASASLLGARNAVTFSLFRLQQTALSTSSVTDVFSGSSDIIQHGLSLTWSHKLSEYSSLNFLASRTRSEGTTPITQSSTQRLLNLGLTHQFGPRTNGSLGLRNVKFDAQGSGASGYSEKAITGTFSVSF